MAVVRWPLQVLKRAKGIRSLFGTLMMSIPPALNISVLLALLYSL